MFCRKCNQNFSLPANMLVYLEREGVPVFECPDCIRRRLLAFWPFGQFYQRKCDKTGESIISTFSEKAPFPVYKKENWLKDDWEAPQKKWNPNVSFLKQLAELQCQSPHFHMLTDGTAVNSDYCDDIYTSKNCYLTRSLADCEDLYFCYRTVGCKDSLDCVYCYDLEKCFSCTRCWNSYNLKYSLESRDCLDSYFLYDCRGCKNCLLCWNLRNEEYCVFNEKYPKEEYEKIIAKYDFGSWEQIDKLREEFGGMLKRKAIHRSNYNFKCVDSTDNYLTECKNCQECFFAEYGEDCFNVMRTKDAKDVYCATGAYKGELCYLTSQSKSCYNLKFSSYAIACRDSEYLDQCEGCSDCFGCVGIKNKSFCILNKQYSEEEYRDLLKKIIEKMKTDGEYGDFLPLSMAYHGYNDSLGYQYYPLTREEVLFSGGWWQDDGDFSVSADFTEDKLPDNIKDVRAEEFCNKTVKCPKTGRVFRYVSQEIKFYLENNTPLSHYYYNYRIIENFKKMLPLDKREMLCSACGRTMITYYPPEWGYQKIYCEECYQKEIY